ncbi:hypothetical protein ABZ806_04910 [Spirillospora sp. NPDC047418]
MMLGDRQIKLDGINITYENLIPRMRKSFPGTRSRRTAQRTSARSWIG